MVEYIKGCDNTGADPLSRLDFDQIKLLNPNYTINTITRAKARQLNTNNNDVINQNDGCDYDHTNNNNKNVVDNTTSTKETRNSKCFEALSSREVKRFHKLKFILNQDKCVISVGRRSVVVVLLTTKSFPTTVGTNTYIDINNKSRRHNYFKYRH